jgi:small GTP-binding protein
MSNNIFSVFGNQPPKKSIKIVLIGDGGVGKTSYFTRLAHGFDDDYKFNKNYNASLGCDVCQLDTFINGFPIRIHLFDTAGQEKFDTLRDSYIMGCDGIILMYDITIRQSKQNVIDKWLPKIRRIITESGQSTTVPIVVVGNKSDETHKARTEFGVEQFEFRDAALRTAYPIKFGKITKHLMSVKADERLMEPINYLIKEIEGYWRQVNVEFIHHK